MFPPKIKIFCSKTKKLDPLLHRAYLVKSRSFSSIRQHGYAVFEEMFAKTYPNDGNISHHPPPTGFDDIMLFQGQKITPTRITLLAYAVTLHKTECLS